MQDRVYAALDWRSLQSIVDGDGAIDKWRNRVHVGEKEANRTSAVYLHSSAPLLRIETGYFFYFVQR